MEKGCLVNGVTRVVRGTGQGSFSVRRKEFMDGKGSE
jgi:hypothetical protein